MVDDVIRAGDTGIRVVNDREGDAPTMATPKAAELAGTDSVLLASPSPKQVEPALDLGLRKGRRVGLAASKNSLRRNLLWLASLMVLMVLAVWFKDPFMAFFAPPKPVPVQPPVDLPALELTFERVEGSASNIFRYFLDLHHESLMVQVDDLLRDRHVRRDKKVAPELLANLARSIQATGVMDLREDYSGLAPGIYEFSDLSITIGAATRRIKVLNQVEPEIFGEARAMIEKFGINELGLAALAIEPTVLIEKARASLLQGKKMWDEREVRNENLFNAIRAYKECEWYLETIEPKPPFYGEALSAKTDCIRELQRRYDDQWFLAERSVKLREWKEAERQLKVICEMIPDRSDERNRNASKNLVDVERHLSTEE